MDIDYLLLLQQLREITESFLAPIMDWATKTAISTWPFIFLVMVYWAFDRKAGRRMLAGVSLAYVLNGFLKLTFCVYRPWIRDSRIEPYGDAKVAATGYSFPSGHSTSATAKYGSVGAWIHRRNKFIAILCLFMILLTMFSRNYLGVHTPQDVLVGFGATAIMLFIGYKIEDWTDKDPDKRDKIILIAGILLTIALFAYYELKAYPMDYLADGSLLVDPKKMLPDSFEGLGFLSAFVICRYFERRGYDFEKEISWKNRFIIGAFALLPIFWWDAHIVNLLTNINRCMAKFVWASGTIIYVMIVVPYIMKIIHEKKIIK